MIRATVCVCVLVFSCFAIIVFVLVCCCQWEQRMVGFFYCIFAWPVNQNCGCEKYKLQVFGVIFCGQFSKIQFFFGSYYNCIVLNPPFALF